jgi:ABC-type multidrug transport system fused ATPase/permease subunit
MSRVIEDVTSMERVLIDGIEQGLVSAIQVIIMAIALFMTNPRVAIWAVLPLPLLALGSWLYSKNSRQRFRAEREALGELTALLHDNIAGIRQVKAYAAEQEEHQVFISYSEKLREATLRIMRRWAIFSPGMSFLGSLGYVAVLGLGGSAVIQGNLNMGQWMQFFLMMGFMYEPLARLHQLNHLLLSGKAAAVRVFEILDQAEESSASNGKAIKLPVHGDICFEQVCFTYTGDVSTLSDVNLKVKAGQTIALVGPTGAGKSTLLSLLPRFYELTAGCITIDGQDISQLRKSELRSQIGFVTQESFLFNGTVRENLLLGKRNATDSEIIQALKAAHAFEFTQSLPHGLDTNVGERGIKLSGGEKQRISIARALLKNPPILLLDEATASVDTQTEKEIQSALDQLMKNRTSFVIAHRLSTIINADLICVMDHGQIVESGTHQELLKNNGIYATLCQKSFLPGDSFPK